MAVQTSRGGFRLAEAERARLTGHVERALAVAKRSGRALAAITVPAPRGIDPTAVVSAARRDGEPWFALEQPERDGFALAALGSVAELTATGDRRFEAVAGQWRELASAAVCDPPDGPRGNGPVAVGGFSFSASGAKAHHWHEFGVASLHVPQVAFVRHGDDLRMTIAALVHPDDTVDDQLASLDLRLESLEADAALPLWDPDPAGEITVAGAMPPEHYEDAVARAVSEIEAESLEKIVLAREVHVRAESGHQPAAVFGALREAFPSCFCFAVGRGDATFVAASPELLVRRSGARASTIALAGSAQRSADPAVDDHIGEQLLRSPKDRHEQAIVTRRIERSLAPLSVWVTSAPEPELVRVANIQHLATPVRAQLREAIGAIELAGALHPTPAVGGEPPQAALDAIPRLEGLDRGWYAGPVGWTDVNEDGELCVALRCALIDGPLARCYAGVGVVRDSDPGAELAETEIKLQAMVPALGG